MYPTQTDMVRMILLACPLVPEPVGSDPVGSEPVGSFSVIGSTKETAQKRQHNVCMQLNIVCMHQCIYINL